MADSSNAPASWRPWPVAGEDSGFEVDEARGYVGLIQIDTKQFWVTNPFRFSQESVVRMLADRLIRDKAWIPTRRRQQSTTPAPSLPERRTRPTSHRFRCYMRWFESSYGAHTLAAIIHDDLIVDKPNCGPLGSDTLSDRFFREMMRVGGCAMAQAMDHVGGGRAPLTLGGRRNHDGSRFWSGSSSRPPASSRSCGPSGRRPSTGVAPSDSGHSWPFRSCSRSPQHPCGAGSIGAGLVAAIAALWILPAAAAGRTGLCRLPDPRTRREEVRPHLTSGGELVIRWSVGPRARPASSDGASPRAS